METTHLLTHAYTHYTPAYPRITDHEEQGYAQHKNTFNSFQDCSLEGQSDLREGLNATLPTQSTTEKLGREKAQHWEKKRGKKKKNDNSSIQLKMNSEIPKTTSLSHLRTTRALGSK